MDHRQIFQEVALSLEDVVERVDVSVPTMENGRQRGEWKLKYSGEKLNLLETREGLYYLYGKCFEILLSQFNSTMSDVSISTKVNAYVFVHLPGQFLNEDSYSKLDLSPGKLLFIELTYEIIRQTWAVGSKCRKYIALKRSYILMRVLLTFGLRR